MRTFLAKCSAVALIAGGFALTGDAGRLLARGRGVIEATTIPQASESARDAATTDAPDLPDAPSPVADGPHPGTAPESPPPAGAAVDHPADAPVGSTPSRLMPAGSAVDSVNVAALSPGDRILVWIGQGTARGAVATMAFDVVDPATGDAIEVRHASGDDRLSALAPRRRVRLEGSLRQGAFTRSASAPEAGRIDVDRALRISPVEARGGGPSTATAETIGPVVALRIVPASADSP